ncbi:MAG: hypothetical protein AAF632_24370 [Bacteroidota bacterium]
MNSELEKKLQSYLNQDDVTSCILLVERSLTDYRSSDFYKIVGQNLLHQAKYLKNYLDSFMETISLGESTKAIYAEMNGFSINYDQWYIDFFAFEALGDMEDLDWLADWEEGNESESPFIIEGLEPIQNIYKNYHENKLWKNPHDRKVAELCELAVVLKLQELIKKVIEMGKSENASWASMPTFVTAHDYELIYRKN